MVCIAPLLGMGGIQPGASNSIHLVTHGEALFAKPLHDRTLSFGHGGRCDMDDSHWMWRG